MERELIDVVLPSGLKAKIVSYFTHGEDIIIGKAKWTGAMVENVKDQVVIKNIPVNQSELTQEAIVLQGTKEIEGKTVNKEDIDNLRREDFNFLLGKLIKVREPKKKEKN